MKTKALSWLAVPVLIGCLAHGAWAQTETCDSLSGAEREIALSVLRSQHPYDCCDDTILQCLSGEPVCPLTIRLADDVCRRAAAGQSEARIILELTRRAASVKAPTVDIDVSDATPAGDPKARIEIVAYVCARCPFCALHTRLLYESVTSGRLKGKAKLVVRPFVLRSHEGATAGGMAMVAAQELGRFWEMLLDMYDNFNDYDPHKLPGRAAALGMDADRFRKLLEDSDLRMKLVESKKEGIRNGVKATPAIFVNRRNYTADLSPLALEDFLEGEYERLAKQSGADTEAAERSGMRDSKAIPDAVGALH